MTIWQSRSGGFPVQLRFILLFIAISACFLIAPSNNPLPPRAKETVILIHGMGRSRASLWILEQRLKKAGYEMLNFPYGVRGETLDQITDRFLQYVQENVKTDRYYFIGHSLGNIIVRNGFKKEYRPGLSRIVMLTPPNKSPDLAKRFKDIDLYRWIFGDSGQKLSSDAFYETLPMPKVEFGVLAGNKSSELLLNQPSDGTVTVEETKLEGMADFLVLHHSHTFFMDSEDTANACVRFLQTGRFSGTS